MMTKPTIALIAGLFTLIAQFGVILHELDHLYLDDDGEICEFCIIAANGSHQITADAGLHIAAPEATTFFPPSSYRFVLSQNHPSKPARGPPPPRQSSY